MTKESLNNRSVQLNPAHPTYLSSRLTTITPQTVAQIQKAEVASKGSQVKGGVGAIAQAILEESK